MNHLRLLLSAALLCATGALFAPSTVHAQLGGPNTFGYVYDAVPLDFVSAPFGTFPLGDPILGFGDDAEETVTLPWSFEFYGVAYTEVTVGANGGIRFTAGAVGTGFASCFPDSGSSAPAMAPFWDDLNPSAVFVPLVAGVFAWHDTDGGNDRFIVSWDGVPHYDSGFGEDGALQLHLYPGGTFEFHYDDLDFGLPGTADDGGEATIGIQNVEGSADLDPLEVSCDLADPALDGTGLAFIGCADLDGDGWCDPADCDDTDPLVNPDAAEVCDDGVDNDCVGGDGIADDDGDSYVDVDCGGDDCDDDDPALNPGIDADGDGYNACEDCNETFDFINPGEEEICDDGIDNDCSGIDDPADDDLDGYTNIACGGDDCDDSDPAINPGVDADGDTFNVCDDCDDGAADVNADAIEICDTIDNDCDEVIDDVDEDGDGESPIACGGLDCDDTNPLASPGYDGDGDGNDSCDDCNDGDDTIFVGAPELCDGIDQDCDGLDDGQDTDTGTGVAPFEDHGPGPSAAIPDPGTVTSTLTVTTAATLIVDLDVALDITHTWDSDLTVSLESPLGTSVTLFDLVGGSGDNFTDTVLDDEATADITICTETCAPFTGSWIPDGALSDFDGEDPNGDWILTVSDGVGIDSGTLDEWTLTFEFASADDVDADGWVNSCPEYGDCDDTDATIYPDAPEICGDTVDQDCDGIDQEGDEDADGYVDADCGGDDCDDSDPALNPGVDGDGDGSNVCDDCDDEDADNFPGNPEICNDGIDQNCDGGDDLGDADGDGYINEACIGGDDCDDTDAFFNPGLDGDGDGSNFCEDCNDSSDLASPDFEEICGDFIDNDCSGVADDSGDEDGDGFDFCDECDDEDPDINPDADEICDDGIDQDCDEDDLVSDVDGDGYTNADCGDGDDCDDEDADFNPGADEACDGIDLDCDGETVETDLDNDGHYDAACGGTDCDDDAQGVHPDSIEICNGIDDDCDGVFFEGGEDDLDEDGVPGCDGDCDDEDPEIAPGAPELCDGIDNDCDDVIDNGVIRDGDSDNHERLACGGDDCDDANSNVSPTAAEDCADGIDNDCDDLIDADDEDCDFGGGPDCDCESSFAAGDGRANALGLVLLLGAAFGRRRRSKR